MSARCRTSISGARRPDATSRNGGRMECYVLLPPPPQRWITVPDEVKGRVDWFSMAPDPQGFKRDGD